MSIKCNPAARADGVAGLSPAPTGKCLCNIATPKLTPTDRLSCPRPHFQNAVPSPNDKVSSPSRPTPLSTHAKPQTASMQPVTPFTHLPQLQVSRVYRQALLGQQLCHVSFSIIRTPPPSGETNSPAPDPSLCNMSPHTLPQAIGAPSHTSLKPNSNDPTITHLPQLQVPRVYRQRLLKQQPCSIAASPSLQYQSPIAHARGLLSCSSPVLPPALFL
jgi:hypothetical protein